MTRKIFLHLGLSVILLGFIGADVVKAADKPVKIGFVSIFSGRVAFLGKSFIEGMTITAEAINKRGGGY